MEYSCPSVCLSVCVAVFVSLLSVCVHDNSKNNGSIRLKLEHIVVYEIARMNSTINQIIIYKIY